MSHPATISILGAIFVIAVAAAFSFRTEDDEVRALRFNAALAVACTIGMALMAVVLVVVDEFAVALFVGLLALGCSYFPIKRIQELREAARSKR
jgi:hypothetical protein